MKMKFRFNEETFFQNRANYFQFLNNIVYSGIWRIISECSAKVYLVIGIHANQNTFQTHIGVRRIQELAGLSRNSVLKSTNELETLGLVKIIRTTRGENSYKKHIYEIIRDIKTIFTFEQLNTDKLKTLKSKLKNLVKTTGKERKSHITIVGKNG